MSIQKDQEFELKTLPNAIILAAGAGMRMVPINMNFPKALLEVNGERLIERIIRQLHEVEIYEIYVVVGFMKEQFEYLIHKFGVELIVNENYATKNNLHSLNLAADYISNTYIIPCDIWCSKNPFHKNESYSWYMVSDFMDNDSPVCVNSNMEIVSVREGKYGNTMIGISYLNTTQCLLVKEKLKIFDADYKYDKAFWEEALYSDGRMTIYAKVVHAADFVEINTYEQLRALDKKSSQLKSDAINIIANVLQASPSDITNITILKKGMTNRSFLFTCKSKKYIMRIPGEGTDQLINRRKEALVYQAINGKGIGDDIIYMNPENGYKISEFFEGARVCDTECIEDLTKCMTKLRQFHHLNLFVDHEFNIFKQLEFYERLRNGMPSIYKDYAKTKENVLALQPYINDHVETKCLAHIDAVPDNFLFVPKKDTEEVKLIDWEYAGMQDPHVDIAMFCIYSFYNRYQIDQLIDLYFEGNCRIEIRIKIYCYIAACGLLWSNWCEYKRTLGVEFGEYSLKQYEYAKEYYKIAADELLKLL